MKSPCKVGTSGGRERDPLYKCVGSSSPFPIPFLNIQFLSLFLRYLANKMIFYSWKDVYYR